MQNIHYWKISPWDWGKDPVGWEKQWRTCLKEEKIAMGWDAVGDLSGCSLPQIRNRLHKAGEFKRNAKQLWNFRNIRKGAIIVANRGQKETAGIGRVVGEYYYNPKPVHFRHTLPVRWLNTDRRRITRQAGWLKTVIPLTKEDAKSLGILDTIKAGKIIQKYEERIKKRGTFSDQTVKTRKFQQAFRNVILHNYRRKCAVCDINDETFLRGCHIVPVKEDVSIAADPENGICLCVLHDSAFENGIFSIISSRYTVLVADSFKTTSGILVNAISKLNGARISLPIKQLPNKSYLKRHRTIHGF